MTDITNNDLDLEIIPYTNKKNYTKTDLEKFHIVNKDGNIIRNKICNVYAPFGRQTQSENKIKSNKNLTQHIFLLHHFYIIIFIILKKI